MSNDCAYLVILISSHSNEIRFRKNVRPEGAVREFENIVGPHDVKSRLIFVHRVKYGLQHTIIKDSTVEVTLASVSGVRTLFTLRHMHLLKMR